MVIYYLNLIKLTKMIFQFLRDFSTYHPKIRDTSQQKMLINKHADANKVIIKRYLYLEDIFGFCKTFQKVTKNLCFHLIIKTADLQDILYTSMDDDINGTKNSFYLYKPNVIPSVETQLMFNEATQKDIIRRMVYRKTIIIRFISST